MPLGLSKLTANSGDWLHRLITSTLIHKKNKSIHRISQFCNSPKSAPLISSSPLKGGFSRRKLVLVACAMEIIKSAETMVLRVEFMTVHGVQLYQMEVNNKVAGMENLEFC